jgi:Domain of unknown function (DUF4145)
LRIVSFVFDTRSDKLLQSYPPETIDFDSTNLPAKVLATITEAVICHGGGCYVAAAMMIRKALEEVCEERGAVGDTLFVRLEALKSRVVLPVELLTALDDLRLLGNDAAHVKAKTYDSIDRDEVEAAMEVTKEILKAVYQLENLVARLRALKRPAAQPRRMGNELPMLPQRRWDNSFNGNHTNGTHRCPDPR